MQGLLQNMGIMKKILAMMLLLGGVAILTAAASAWKISSLDARYTGLVESELPATTQMVRSNRQAAEIVKNGFRAVTYGPASNAGRSAASEVETIMGEVDESLTKAVDLDPELTSLAADMRGEIKKMHELTRAAVARAETGDQASALRALTEADQIIVDLGKELKRTNDQRIARAEAQSAELSETTRSNLIMTILLSLLATAGALVMAHRVVKNSIVSPLLELNGQMTVLAGGNHAINIPHGERKDEIGTMSRSVAVFRDQAEERARLEGEKQRSQAEQEKVVASVGAHLDLLAAGDLTAEIREDYPPSYVQLKESFNSAILSLGGLIRSVAESASQIRTGSSEIAQASEDLARRTESNAASLEETSAAIVQMDGRLKASASAASATVGRADQAISTVTGGRELADEAVQAMGRVSESAKGIDSVIEGLDKIAFQTRVLAMNAAVEAGRAGEAGRGFAVVADLVSALAMRAEEEAKRARDQLTVTQTDIGSAVGAVEKVDAALQNISADVGEVHALLGSMASDNQAQALAITEINSAIASMDQSTQQNAAMVEETSAAARNLLSEVNGLAEQSGRFRYSGAATSGHSASGRASNALAGRAPVVPTRSKEGSYNVRWGGRCRTIQHRPFRAIPPLPANGHTFSTRLRRGSARCSRSGHWRQRLLRAHLGQ